jgi:hypothetical protein
MAQCYTRAVDGTSTEVILPGAIRGCNIGHNGSLESPQADVLYVLVNQVLYEKSL